MIHSFLLCLSSSFSIVCIYHVPRRRIILYQCLNSFSFHLRFFFLMPSARSSSWFVVLWFWLVVVWYWCSSSLCALFKVGSVSMVFSKKSRLARTQLSRNAAIESPKAHHLTKSAVGFYRWRVFLVVSVIHIPGVSLRESCERLLRDATKMEGEWCKSLPMLLYSQRGHWLAKVTSAI